MLSLVDYDDLLLSSQSQKGILQKQLWRKWPRCVSTRSTTWYILVQWV